MLNFKDYTIEALSTASYPNIGGNLIYPALGLCGEAGEVAEKIKKLWRNEHISSGRQLKSEQTIEVVKELGDCLWYIAALAFELNIDLSYIAEKNLEKLKDRKERNVIKSEGDNR